VGQLTSDDTQTQLSQSTMIAFCTEVMSVTTVPRVTVPCEDNSVSLRHNIFQFLILCDTLCPKKHVTTFSTITLTIGVRLQ